MSLRKVNPSIASTYLAGALVGLLAVCYAKLIGAAQAFFLASFGTHSLLTSICSPGFFFLAVWLVERFAPPAKGSGIPQVLEAIDLPTEGGRTLTSELVSLRTAAVKVVSSVLGILGGASIGREGPTVQIAASGFAWIGRRFERFAKAGNFALLLSPRTLLTAGAAAGIAAAFNTPIAGIAFAIEEVAEGSGFGHFRRDTMVAVIISGIVAQGLVGDYLYFGHPVLDPAGASTLVLEALFIGILGGAFGGGFARLLAFPNISRLPVKMWKRALVTGGLCALINWATHGDTGGSGYEPTRLALESSSIDGWSMVFPFAKLVTTVLSYLSGMAGGIFSPSLSIGAGLGFITAKLAHLSNFKTCGLLGMVAFFSGAIQAPLTGVIIVTEMTDSHMLVLPFLVASFLAQAIGRLFMEKPLYRYLATRDRQA